MGSRDNLLVVAPNAQLRASIAFLLRAEGYDVTAEGHVPERRPENLHRAPCAVVDEEAFVGRPDAWARLHDLADSFVMVMSSARPFPADFLVLQVEKPLLGQGLVEAVKSAIGGMPNGST